MNKQIKRIDVMTNIETLGKTQNPPVFQIAAAAFDIETGEIISTFNKTADISTFNNIEGGTLLWWLNTDKELLTQLLNKGFKSGVTEKELVDDFVNWYNNVSLLHLPIELTAEEANKQVFLLGNGILFDNRIIKNRCLTYDIPYPVFYRNDRDMRTLVELAALKGGFADDKAYRDAMPKDGVEHDAFEDVKHQIKVLSQAFNEVK